MRKNVCLIVMALFCLKLPHIMLVEELYFHIRMVHIYLGLYVTLNIILITIFTNFILIIMLYWPILGGRFLNPSLTLLI